MEITLSQRQHQPASWGPWRPPWGVCNLSRLPGSTGASSWGPLSPPFINSLPPGSLFSTLSLTHWADHKVLQSCPSDLQLSDPFPTFPLSTCLRMVVPKSRGDQVIFAGPEQLCSLAWTLFTFGLMSTLPCIAWESCAGTFKRRRSLLICGLSLGAAQCQTPTLFSLPPNVSPQHCPAPGLFPGLVQEPLVQTLFSVHLDIPQPLTQIPGFLLWLLWWLLQETGRLPSSRVLEYVTSTELPRESGHPLT